jgi:hypothetical protein
MATQEEKDEQTFFAGKVKEQEHERKHTMAATEKEDKRETTKGYSGVAGEEGYPAPEYAAELPEGSVISPVGVTRPPEPGIVDPYRKERSKDKQLAGKVLMKGKTHHGFEYERIVDVLQPRTEKGMFQWFKAHFPDAVDEDFSAKAVSDEEAEKLEKKWADELRGKEKDERDRKNKEFVSGSATKKEDKHHV